MRRVVIFNYNSRFSVDLMRMVGNYNLSFPGRHFDLGFYKYDSVVSESDAGKADGIIHSGGDGRPVKEDVTGIPKLYICYSHQWKAQAEGGRVARLSGCVSGVQEIDVIEDDKVLGKKGKLPIMQFHEFAVVEPPSSAKVVATSRGVDEAGKEVEIIEALRYDDDSISVQGHPEEGVGSMMLYNLFNTVALANVG